MCPFTRQKGITKRMDRVPVEISCRGGYATAAVERISMAHCRSSLAGDDDSIMSVLSSDSFQRSRRRYIFASYWKKKENSDLNESFCSSETAIISWPSSTQPLESPTRNVKGLRVHPLQYEHNTLRHHDSSSSLLLKEASLRHETNDTSLSRRSHVSFNEIVTLHEFSTKPSERQSQKGWAKWFV